MEHPQSCADHDNQHCPTSCCQEDNGAIIFVTGKCCWQVDHAPFTYSILTGNLKLSHYLSSYKFKTSFFWLKLTVFWQSECYNCTKWSLHLFKPMFLLRHFSHTMTSTQCCQFTTQMGYFKTVSKAKLAFHNVHALILDCWLAISTPAWQRPNNDNMVGKVKIKQVCFSVFFERFHSHSS